MAVKIRLTKTGGKNDVCYRIIATDSRSPRDGRFLENLGWYDPKKKGVNYLVKLERVAHWKNLGAEMTDTVVSIVKKAQKAAK